ncbi:Vps5 C terminal like-domain-containing protein, partial [Hygrophoropsis aurantiaca]
DSDDDTPIAQSSKFRSIQSHHSQPQSQPTQPQTEPVFVITVDDPQRVGDPIRAYTMYTVHTNTTSSAFPKSSFSVLRRYSDFLWLYDTLSSNNPGIIVPPVPEKNPFGRFDDGFVQQRRRELQKCVQKIANHPVLVKDADFESFLYSDSFALDIKHRKAESAHERGGLMASIGQTLTGPRFYETDEWFDKQKTYLDGLESQLRGLVKAIDTVAKQRVELSTATGEFAAALSELAAAAQSAAQTHAALNALADVARTAEAVQSAQAQLDVGGLMSTADEYSRLVNSVRLAFAARIRTYTAWQNADADARRVRARGAGGAGYNDRNGSGFNERSGGGGGGGADRRALDAKHAFDTATRRIKAELGRFEAERVEDFKRALAALLAGMIRGQGEVIAAWERYQGLLLKPSSASSLGAGVVA